MYEELLNIIYTYTINKKVPDDNFGIEYNN